LKYLAADSMQWFKLSNALKVGVSCIVARLNYSL
jgi:hypothetical protein